MNISARHESSPAGADRGRAVTPSGRGGRPEVVAP